MQVLFSMKRTLRCMKSEAGLRPMKRGFAARRDTGASLHTSAASASRNPTGFRFTFADGKRFITDYVAIAREIAAATGEFYFTFCVCKTLYAFIQNRFCGSFFVLSCIVKNPKIA